MNSSLLLSILSIMIIGYQISFSWSTDSTTNTVVASGNSNQEYVSICKTTDGSYIVAFSDDRNSSADIYAQKYDSMGVAQWTTNGILICNAIGNQYQPKVVSDGSGGVIFVWTDSRNGNRDIYAQRVNSSGAKQWSTDGVAIRVEDDVVWNLEMIPDGFGGAIIAWADQRDGIPLNIYAQKIDSNGVVQWSTNGVLVDSTTYSSQYVQLVSDGSGGAILTWSSFNLLNGDIFAQRINSNGIIQWNPGGVVICDASGHQKEPKISSDNSNGAIIAWSDYRNSNSDIYAQRINSSGIVQWSNNGVLICNASNTQYVKSVIGDGLGGAYITWSDSRGPSYYAYAQRINSSGTSYWTNNGIQIGPDSTSAPVAVSDNNNGITIAITKSIGGSDNYLLAQRIDTSGTLLWGTNGIIASTKLYGYPDIFAVESGTGGIVAVWEYDNTSDYDVYMQYVGRKGQLGRIPIVTTSGSITDIGVVSAVGNGTVIDGDNLSIIARGLVWSTSSNPTLSDNSATTGSGIGSYSTTMTGLQGNYTTYYVRAFATNSAGTAYGDNVSFTTVPTLPEWALIILLTLAATYGGYWVFKRFV